MEAEIADTFQKTASNAKPVQQFQLLKQNTIWDCCSKEAEDQHDRTSLFRSLSLTDFSLQLIC